MNIQIQNLNIENNVNIIQENFTFEKILNLINSNGSVFYASRGSVIPPQVYAAIQLGKEIYISESHRIIPPLKEFCKINKDIVIDFGQEFHVPRVCENFLFKAIRLNTDDLFDSYMKTEKSVISNEKIEEIIQMAKSVFEKIKTDKKN